MGTDVDSFKVWERMGTIKLEEMDSIKLMNRVDTKYLTTESILEKVLDKAADNGYRALEVEGSTISPYNSLYFDTDSLKMFQDHHNRRLVRQKVRTRVYVSTSQTFLEIKRKNNKGRTKKKRTEIPSEAFADFRSNASAARFLSEHSDYSVDLIKPRLETLFRRITLVNRAKTERLTIDTSLTADLGSAVIIELKQDGRAESEMKRILLDCRVKPVRISKYCIGTTVTNPSAKSNRFKVKVRRIEKTTGEKIIVR